MHGVAPEESGYRNIRLQASFGAAAIHMTVQSPCRTRAPFASLQVALPAAGELRILRFEPHLRQSIPQRVPCKSQ
jgi:hypothetical protein